MSNLVLLGGPPGVGKTAVLRLLKRRLACAAFLDADDVWNVTSDIATGEHRDIALANVIAVMRGYFNAGCELGILSWVFARSALYDPVVSGLDDIVQSVIQIYLVATPEILEQRMLQRRVLKSGDNNLQDAIEYSINRLQLIQALPYPKIDTSDLSPEQVEDEIVARIEQSLAGP
jgi:thymidylate kinase